MDRSVQDIGAAFDARAARYNQNDWHRICAERLVAFGGAGPGAVVLDAGTGTGFAAIAAARAAGPRGRVVAIDLSRGMLDIARQHEPAPGSAPIDWVYGDAAGMTEHEAETFDVVLCAAALLYMPVSTALSAWHRLLKPDGTVAVSSMRAGSPVAGRLFRECAASFGFGLADPSAALGSESTCCAALEVAGFRDCAVASEALRFTPQDRAMAWESNLGSPAHEVVRSAGDDVLAAMRTAFIQALEDEERRAPGSTTRAEVLFAKARR